MKKPRWRRQAWGGIQDQLVFQRREEIHPADLQLGVNVTISHPIEGIGICSTEADLA